MSAICSGEKHGLCLKNQPSYRPSGGAGAPLAIIGAIPQRPGRSGGRATVARLCREERISFAAQRRSLREFTLHTAVDSKQ
jgi:hypothetical protein